MTLLTTTDMSVTFGGLRAVDGVDFEVRPGQLVGLIGPNGAGKTTFIDGVTGFVHDQPGASTSTATTSPRCRPINAPAAASDARGSRWSCSTT